MASRADVGMWRSGHERSDGRPECGHGGSVLNLKTPARSQRLSSVSCFSELLAMASGFRAIAAGGHVAPPPSAILRAVVEDVSAASVSAPAHALQLAEDECAGRRFDNWKHQSGEGIAHGDKGPRVGAITAALETPSSSTSSEHAIDLA